ncbi:MAG: protein translocase subunit SecF [Candidatus Paceibacterota bacterium]|jgi:preprotein translocase subunit SecF
MFVARNSKFFVSLFVLVTLAGILSLWYFGLNFGIDFTGGTLIEIAYLDARPDVSQIKSSLSGIKALGSDFIVQTSGDKGLVIKAKELSETDKNEVITTLAAGASNKIEIRRSDSIGPSIGQELKANAIKAIILVILCIMLFIAFAFRQVSFRVKSWKYGMITVATLVHDVFVPVGIFAALGHYLGYEIDALFVTAILTILGYSVHDTIVVFDRIRENLKVHKNEKLVDIAGISLRQTVGRSITTSLTVFLSLVVLYVFGGDTTKIFALTMSMGVIFGTLSSVFMSVPLLVLIAGEGKYQK